MVEAAQQRRQLLSAPAQRAQLSPRVLRDVQGPLDIEQRRTLGRLFAVRRVQHTAGWAPPLADLPRRPALPEDLADHRRRRRRRKRLGGDLVVVDAVDRPHVLGRPHPHPVLRGLHPAVLEVPVRRQPHEVHPPRPGLPPPSQPRHDLLLRLPEHRVGRQQDAHRHGCRLGYVVGRGCHGAYRKQPLRRALLGSRCQAGTIRWRG